MLRLTLLLIVLSSLVGCVAPGNLAMPTEMKNRHTVALVRSELLNQTSGTLMHLDTGKNVLYQQNYGGGGAAVGVLLGPIGVAANMAAIESNTKDDVKLLFGKTDVDPNEVFKEIIEKAGLSVADKSALPPSLSPYVLVSKGENDVLYFASAILVEYGEDKSPSRWIGRYMYQSDMTFTKDQVAQGLSEAQITTLKASLRGGFEELASLYKKDVDNGLAVGADVKFKSEFVNPRFNFEMQGTLLADGADRVCIRMGAYVFSLPKEKVTLATK